MSTSRCGRAPRCRTRSGARRLCSRRLHGVAAGRRAQRQPRRGAAALRRLREDHRDGEAQDDLGAGLSGDPHRRWRSSSSSIIVLKVVPAFSDFYASSAPSCRCRPGSSSASRTSSAGSSAADRWHRAWRWPRSSRWMRQPGQQARVRPACCSSCRCSATIAAKFATSQMARTLATLLGGGMPLVNALDIAARVDRQPVHGARARRSSARACAKASRSRPRSRRAACFRTSRSRWWRSASRPARCRTC